MAADPFSDKYTIETPEQMPLEFAIAGIGSRFLAMAIDTLIQVAFGVVVFIAVIIANVVWPQPGSRLWIAGAAIALLFLLTFAYFAIFEIWWNGQTPGKRKAGIRVIKDSGRPLTVAETIGRNLLRIVDQLPVFYALGVLIAFLNSRNKRLGDFIAGSIVIRETPLADLKPEWQNARTAPPPLSPLVSPLSAEDLDLIDAFLNRRSHLTADVRSRIAEEIFERIRPKLPAQDGLQVPGLTTESVLEWLVSQRVPDHGHVPPPGN
jgi:uncharacterized RDD family membrane protein YckC